MTLDTSEQRSPAPEAKSEQPQRTVEQHETLEQRGDQLRRKLEDFQRKLKDYEQKAEDYGTHGQPLRNELTKVQQEFAQLLVRYLGTGPQEEMDRRIEAFLQSLQKDPAEEKGEVSEASQKGETMKKTIEELESRLLYASVESEREVSDELRRDRSWEAQTMNHLLSALGDPRITLQYLQTFRENDPSGQTAFHAHSFVDQYTDLLKSLKRDISDQDRLRIAGLIVNGEWDKLSKMRTGLHIAIEQQEIERLKEELQKKDQTLNVQRGIIGRTADLLATTSSEQSGFVKKRTGLTADLTDNLNRQAMMTLDATRNLNASFEEKGNIQKQIDLRTLRILQLQDDALRSTSPEQADLALVRAAVRIPSRAFEHREAQDMRRRVEDTKTRLRESGAWQQLSQEDQQLATGNDIRALQAKVENLKALSQPLEFQGQIDSKTNFFMSAPESRHAFLTRELEGKELEGPKPSNAVAFVTVVMLDGSQYRGVGITQGVAELLQGDRRSNLVLLRPPRGPFRKIVGRSHEESISDGMASFSWTVVDSYRIDYCDVLDYSDFGLRGEEGELSSIPSGGEAPTPISLTQKQREFTQSSIHRAFSLTRMEPSDLPKPEGFRPYLDKIASTVPGQGLRTLITSEGTKVEGVMLQYGVEEKLRTVPEGYTAVLQRIPQGASLQKFGPNANGRGDLYGLKATQDALKPDDIVFVKKKEGTTGRALSIDDNGDGSPDRTFTEKDFRAQEESRREVLQMLPLLTPIQDIERSGQEILARFGPLQGLLEGMMGGKPTEQAVRAAKNYARSLLDMTMRSKLLTECQKVREVIAALRSIPKGVMTDEFDDALLQTEQQLRAVEQVMSSGAISKLCKGIETLRPDTFATWWDREGKIIVAACLVAVLAATGIGAPIAGALASAGLIVKGGVAALAITSIASGVGAYAGVELGKGWSEEHASDFTKHTIGEISTLEYLQSAGLQIGQNAALSFALIGSGQYLGKWIAQYRNTAGAKAAVARFLERGQKVLSAEEGLLEKLTPRQAKLFSEYLQEIFDETVVEKGLENLGPFGQALLVLRCSKTAGLTLGDGVGTTIRSASREGGKFQYTVDFSAEKRNVLIRSLQASNSAFTEQSDGTIVARASDGAVEVVTVFAPSSLPEAMRSSLAEKNADGAVLREAYGIEEQLDGTVTFRNPENGPPLNRYLRSQGIVAPLTVGNGTFTARIGDKEVTFREQAAAQPESVTPADAAAKPAAEGKADAEPDGQIEAEQRTSLSSLERRCLDRQQQDGVLAEVAAMDGEVVGLVAELVTKSTKGKTIEQVQQESGIDLSNPEVAKAVLLSHLMGNLEEGRAQIRVKRDPLIEIGLDLKQRTYLYRNKICGVALDVGRSNTEILSLIDQALSRVGEVPVGVKMTGGGVDYDTFVVTGKGADGRYHAIRTLPSGGKKEYWLEGDQLLLPPQGRTQPAPPLRVGEKVWFGDNPNAKVLARRPDGSYVVEVTSTNGQVRNMEIGPDRLHLLKRQRGVDEAQRPSETSEHREVLRERNILSIADIHGDVVALHNSLLEAGYIDVQGNLTEKGRTSKIVLTGDLLDRGKANLGVLRKIQWLQQAGARITILAGNHDVFMLDALTTGDQTAMATWLKNGGSKVLEEIQQQYPGSDPLTKARELFTGKGQYAGVFRSMKIMEQVDDVLYVHAGIDDVWAGIIEREGIEGANRKFQELMATGQLSQMMEGKKYSAAVWMRRNPPPGSHNYGSFMTEQRAQILRQRGIRTIVHGHDQQGGGQTISDEFGLRVVNGDTGMSSAYYGGSGSVEVGRRGDLSARDRSGERSFGFTGPEARAQQIEAVKGRVGHLPETSQGRAQRIGEGAALLRADGHIVDERGRPIDLSNPNTPHALGILAAHDVGRGEVGRDGRKPAGIDNYTDAQIRRKAEILRNAGFTDVQRRLIIEAGIAGVAVEANTTGTTSAAVATPNIETDTVPMGLQTETAQGSPDEQHADLRKSVDGGQSLIAARRETGASPETTQKAAAEMVTELTTLVEAAANGDPAATARYIEKMGRGKLEGILKKENAELVAEGKPPFGSVEELVQRKLAPKSKKVLANIRDGKIGLGTENYVGKAIRDLDKMMPSMDMEMKQALNRQLHEAAMKNNAEWKVHAAEQGIDPNSLDNYMEWLLSPDQTIEGERPKAPNLEETTFAGIDSATLSSEGVGTRLADSIALIAKGQGEFSRAAVEKAIADVKDPVDHAILLETATILEDMTSKAGNESLGSAERWKIMEFSARYLQDFRAADFKATPQQLLNTITDNAVNLAHQNIMDHKTLVGSSHGALHVLNGNATMLLGMYDQLKFTPRMRVLAMQATFDHDMGYTKRTLTGSTGAQGVFDASKDHPLESTLRIEANREKYVAVFGVKGYETIRNAILDHSDALGQGQFEGKTTKLQLLVDENAPSSVRVEAAVACVDCLATVSNLKASPFIRNNPDVLATMARIQQVWNKARAEGKTKGPAPADMITDPVLKAEADAIRQGLIDRIKAMDDSKLSPEAKQAYITSLESTMTWADYMGGFAINLNLQMLGSSVSSDLRIDEQGGVHVEYTVDPDGLTLIGETVGAKDAAEMGEAGIQKAAGDFGKLVAESKQPLAEFVRNAADLRSKDPAKRMAADTYFKENGGKLQLMTNSNLIIDLTIGQNPEYTKMRETANAAMRIDQIRAEAKSRLDTLLTTGTVHVEGADVEVEISSVEAYNIHMRDSIDTVEANIPDDFVMPAADGQKFVPYAEAVYETIKATEGQPKGIAVKTWQEFYDRMSRGGSAAPVHSSRKAA